MFHIQSGHLPDLSSTRVDKIRCLSGRQSPDYWFREGDNLDQTSEKENKVDGGHCLVKGHTEPAQNNLQQSKRMCLAIGIIIVISIGMLGITSPN